MVRLASLLLPVLLLPVLLLLFGPIASAEAKLLSGARNSALAARRQTWAALPLRFHDGGRALAVGNASSSLAAAGGAPAGALRRRLLRRARRRGLLGANKAVIAGSVNGGYYDAVLEVGTPPQRFTLVLDTGSSTTYVACSTCRRCGNHTSAPFDFAASATASKLPCSAPYCTARFACAGAAPGVCSYAETYKEGSSSEGFLFRDTVRLPGSGAPALEAVVGCAEYESGMIYGQRADGLLGLGNSKRSLPAQVCVFASFV